MNSGRTHSDFVLKFRWLHLAFLPIFIVISFGCESETNFSARDNEQAIEDQDTAQDAEAIAVGTESSEGTEEVDSEPEFTEDTDEGEQEPEFAEESEEIDEPEINEEQEDAGDTETAEEPELSDEPEMVEEPEILEASDAAAPVETEEIIMEDAGEDEMVTEELSAPAQDTIETMDPLKKKCGTTDQNTVSLTLPSYVQACLDQGLMYNFVTDACASKAPIDKNFACTMDNIEAKMKELDIPGAEIDKLKADIAGGARYFACSLRDAGNMLIVQHWKSELTPETTTCDSNFKTFLSGCYRKVFNSDIKNPETPEEVQAQVNSCMEDEL